MTPSCELQDIETIATQAGVILVGPNYDKWQDYLQDNCTCQTYRALIEWKEAAK